MSLPKRRTKMTKFFKIGDHVEAVRASGNAYMVIGVLDKDFYRVRRLRGGKLYGASRLMAQASLKLTYDPNRPTIDRLPAVTL